MVWRGLASELLTDVVTGETALLVLLAPVFPFLRTSPVMVTQVFEAPLPSARPFSQMPWHTGWPQSPFSLSVLPCKFILTSEYLGCLWPCFSSFPWCLFLWFMMLPARYMLLQSKGPCRYEYVALVWSESLLQSLSQRHLDVHRSIWLKWSSHSPFYFVHLLNTTEWCLRAPPLEWGWVSPSM